MCNAGRNLYRQISFKAEEQEEDLCRNFNRGRFQFFPKEKREK